MSNTTKSGVIFLGLVTDEQYTIIIEYYAEVGTVISLIGIISNIINIRTFIVMGLSDGITVSFLALAIFDLSYLIVSFALGISVSFLVTELRTTTRFPIDPYAVAIILSNIMYLLHVNNVLITTFLAVARCMCVAKPLQFKNSFTRKRTICVVTGFTIFAVVIYTPVLANMGIVPQFDKMTNSTRSTLWFSTTRQTIKVIVWVLTDMVLPCTTQVIIVICIIIMASCLRVASRFRQSSVMTSEKVSYKGSERNTSSEKDKWASSGVVNHSTNKLSGKDLRVVQQHFHIGFAMYESLAVRGISPLLGIDGEAMAKIQSIY